MLDRHTALWMRRTGWPRVQDVITQNIPELLARHDGAHTTGVRGRGPSAAKITIHAVNTCGTTANQTIQLAGVHVLSCRNCEFVDLYLYKVVISKCALTNRMSP